MLVSGFCLCVLYVCGDVRAVFRPCYGHGNTNNAVIMRVEMSGFFYLSEVMEKDYMYLFIYLWRCRFKCDTKALFLSLFDS